MHLISIYLSFVHTVFTQVSTARPGEYYNTDSLCDFANTHDQNANGRKLKIFMLLRNPIVSSIIKFRQVTNPSNKFHSKELNGIDFQGYMRKSMNGNLLTRSILCKSKDENLTVSILVCD